MSLQQGRYWELFKCQRCGRCCIEIGLPYDPESIFEVAKFLNLSVDDVINKYYGRVSSGCKSWKSNDEKRTPCPFLKNAGNKKACLIYQVRPMGCRLYPFDTDIGRQGVDCPGARLAYHKLEEA